MYRTRTCGDLRLADEGLVVTLAGWVQKTRKMGGMTFVDIRDRYGITQLVFNQEVDAALCEKANKLGREFVIQEIADENGIAAIAEGSNVDDMGDYRPGLTAVAELGIKSPLRHCNLTKADIRALSRYLNLPTWKKQSFACLSSRFVYGETITEEKLGMVDKAEQLLLDLSLIHI